MMKIKHAVKKSRSSKITWEEMQEEAEKFGVTPNSLSKLIKYFNPPFLEVLEDKLKFLEISFTKEFCTNIIYECSAPIRVGFGAYTEASTIYFTIVVDIESKQIKVNKESFKIKEDSELKYLGLVEFIEDFLPIATCSEEGDIPLLEIIE